MSERGQILLADDEEVFGASTADLLRRQGYSCDVVPDGETALARVGQGSYDLLISDLEMPGNEDLALVRQVSQRVGGLPIVILTGFPSTRSAIACIELPVVAYLVKPVGFDQLLGKVDAAVVRFRSYTAMRRTEERLRDWNREVAAVAAPGASGGPESIDAFLTLTLRNVMGSLTDLGELSRALAQTQQGPHACQLVNCPRGLQLQEAVRETVQVLEETKGAFRSKTLATLRRQLEVLLSTV